MTVTDGTGTTVIGGNQVAVGGASPIVIDGDAGTIGGLTNITFDPDNITSGQAATEDQLKQVNDATNAGWNLSADGDTATNVAPGGAVELGNTDGNISVARNATDENKLSFDLAENIDMGVDGSVTTGDSVLNNGGLTVDDGTNSTTVTAGGIRIEGGANGAVSLTDAGLDNGGNKIVNVAPGTVAAGSTDAVNGGQLYDVANTPITFAGDAGTNVERKLGEQVNVVGGATNETTLTEGNIGVVADGTDTLAVKLNKDIDLGADGSVTTGNTAMNNAGVTVSDGAGNSTVIGSNQIAVGGSNPIVINGNAGTIGGLTNTTFDPDNITSGQAATEDQLKQVNSAANAGWNVADANGNTNNIGPNGKVTFNGDSNVTVTESGTDDDGAITVALKRDLDLDSVTTGNTVVNNSGVTIINPAEPGASVVLGNNGLAVDDGAGNSTATTEQGTIVKNAAGESNTITAGGNVVTNAAGDTTTVDAGSVVVSDGNGTSTIGGNQIVVGGTNGIVLNGDTGRIGGLTNTTFDPDNITSGQAATEDQLKSVNDAANAGWNVADANGNSNNIGPDGKVTFNGDSNVTVTESGTDDDGAITVALKRDLDLDSVTTGNTIVNNNGVAIGPNVMVDATGLIIAGGPSVTTAGIDAGNTRITNVAAGIDPTDAVNVSQLKDLADSISGGDRAVQYDGSAGDPKNTVTLEGDQSTDGGRTGGTKVTNVARGDISENSTDAVNGSQIHDMGNSIADGMGGNSRFEDGKLVTELNVGGNTYNNVNEALNGVDQHISDVEQTANAGWQVQANDGQSSKVAPGSTVAFENGDNIEISHKAENGKNTITVGLSQDIKVNSITAVKVQADEIKVGDSGPIINEDGIDMNDKGIHNVAAGTKPTDAVNLGQLESATDNLSNQVNALRGDVHRMDNRLSAGVAAAMATASLPQAYLPGKTMMSVAGATWRGESGMAIGFSGISDNGKWVYKVSGNSTSRGDYGGAVGVGYQW